MRWVNIGSHHVPSLLIVFVLGWLAVGISGLVKRGAARRERERNAALSAVAGSLERHLHQRFQAERDGRV